MSYIPVDHLAEFTDQIKLVQPEDTIADAGRKVLLGELVTMLQHEGGSRTGENIEDVHDMRVTTRRMRSLLRLLTAYYKSKTIKGYSHQLRQLGWALGSVRDLDVLIEDLQKFKETLAAEDQTTLQEMIDWLDQKRAEARAELVDILDSKTYRRFIRDFSSFLTDEKIAANLPDAKEVVPVQVRHVLPMLIHDRLAAVRAYDAVLATADAPTLHQLRIEFKRLRYAVSLFEDVLGGTVKDYVEEIKRIQDSLGRMNDIHTARARLNALLDGEENQFNGVLGAYLAYLETEEPTLKSEFPEIWERFKSCKVQQKLSNALLALT